MSNKFFYLYLAGGTIFLFLLIYQLVVNPVTNDVALFLNLIPVLLLYYMAYKVRREKEDKDLM